MTKKTNTKISNVIFCNHFITIFINLLVALFFSTSVLAKVADNKPDFNREKRLINQVVDAIFEGDVIDLKVSRESKDEPKTFKGVYIAAEKTKKLVRTAVLILHNRGYHLDWPDVINPVRLAVAEAGYHSLSIQLPVLEKQATYYDYLKIFDYSRKRILVGIDFLRKQEGVKKVVVIAHGCGNHMTADLLVNKGVDIINGFVGISLNAVDAGQEEKISIPYDKLNFPVLDIYGGKDFLGVISNAKNRKKLAKNLSRKSLFSQIKITDAEHYFKETRHRIALTRHIKNWLKRNFK